MRRIRWSVVMELVGAVLVLGTQLYLSMTKNPNTTWALLAIGGVAMLWTLALLHPDRRDAQAWERSAQVAFLVLALGQVGTVASSRRAQEATERRMAEERQASENRTRREDSLAEARQDRADDRAWSRDVRADSLLAAREEREAAARRAADQRQREAQQAAELAATRNQLAAADDEMRIRLRALTDSIGVLDLVAPQRRGDDQYGRATNALTMFLKPRNREGAGLQSTRTFDLVSFVARVVGDAETNRALRCLERITSSWNNRTTPTMGVSTNWMSPDTMSVGWDSGDTDEHMVIVGHRPVSEVVHDLSCTRWMLAGEVSGSESTTSGAGAHAEAPPR
jgi:hypothetical protein